MDEEPVSTIKHKCFKTFLASNRKARNKTVVLVQLIPLYHCLNNSHYTLHYRRICWARLSSRRKLVMTTSLQVSHNACLFLQRLLRFIYDAVPFVVRTSSLVLSSSYVAIQSSNTLHPQSHSPRHPSPS